MALDPNIALGVRQIEMPNQLAQYAQLSQIQNAQQANQLSQMQMAEYERARREEENTRNFLAKADLADPNVRAQLLTGYGKAGREIATTLTAADKARSEDLARQTKLAQDTQAMYQNISGIISNKSDAVKFLSTVVNDPAMKDSPLAKIPLMQQVARIPEDPAGLDDWKKQFALGATKYITENKPVTFAQDTGTGGRVMSRPGLGGAATVVPGSEFTKGMTFADRNAAARLAFDQNKFAWEKANPGYELKEAEDGSIVGVNKRTLQAFPVSIGGAAPAAPMAAPAASGMPGARVQAIPGMNSVLDQQAPTAVPVAGTPLRGKGTALTESQGNATAYGMRMKEANAVLEPLEKAGKTNTGLIKGAVGGTVGLVPFIGDKLEDVSGSIFNALPRVLGGLSPEQQQVAQARINFITALLRKNPALQLVQVNLRLRKRITFQSLVMTMPLLHKNNKPVKQLFVQWKSKQAQVLNKWVVLALYQVQPQTILWAYQDFNYGNTCRVSRTVSAIRCRARCQAGRLVAPKVLQPDPQDGVLQDHRTRRSYCNTRR